MTTFIQNRKKQNENKPEFQFDRHFKQVTENITSIIQAASEN